MELESIMLSKISQAQKAKYHILHLYVESRPKMMRIIIIMGHEYKRGTVRRVKKGEGKRGKEIKVCYIYIKIV
jgi:hypothetical protein